MQEEAVIYQFKTGLLQWILTQLPTTELNFILTMETNPGVEIKPIDMDILMKLVMRIEANLHINAREQKLQLEDKRRPFRQKEKGKPFKQDDQRGKPLESHASFVDS